MIHPHTELKFINEEIGCGVFATKLIPRGTIVWTLCEFDRRMTFSAEEVNAMNADYQAIVGKYSYTDSSGNYVLCWDLARYMNHSCLSNSWPVDDFNYIAVRDILPAEEITCDYSFLNYQTMPCLCGEDNCRQEIKPNDYLSLSFKSNGEKLIQEALAYFDKVEQPLYKFIKEKDLLLSLKNNPTTIEW